VDIILAPFTARRVTKQSDVAPTCRSAADSYTEREGISALSGMAAKTTRVKKEYDGLREAQDSRETFGLQVMPILNLLLAKGSISPPSIIEVVGAVCEAFLSM